MRSLSLVQKNIVSTATHFVVCAVLGIFSVACEAHAATQNTPCPVRTNSLLATSYKSQKIRLEGQDVVPPELTPCLNTWHSADWKGPLYMWSGSKRGEEPYSLVMSPSVEASLEQLVTVGNTEVYNKTPDLNQTNHSLNTVEDVKPWQSSLLANSSGHQLLEFHDVYVMCMQKAGFDVGPNCTWLVASPSDCQTWDLEMENLDYPRITEMSKLTIEAIEVDTAITIAHMRGGAIYHAPIDLISSLVHVNSSILWNDSVYLHVHAPSTYVKDWLSVVGISPDRLISGGFRAKRLYVPEQRTENPSRTQLTWLQHRVWTGIGFPDLAKRNLLIVSKRTHRGISNHGEVVQLAKEYAATHGLEVFVHDDQNLPPVKEQLQFFSRAVMYLAPHGAGECMIVASLHGACVVEMFPRFYYDTSLARLFVLLGHHYTGIDMSAALGDSVNPMFNPLLAWGDAPNSPVNSTELRLAMQRCGDRAGVL